MLLFRRPALAVLSQVCVGARGTPLAIRVYPLHSSSDSSACLLWRPCFKPTFAPLSRTWSFATPFVPEPLHLTAPHGDEAFFICLSGEDDNWAVAHSPCWTPAPEPFKASVAAVRSTTGTSCLLLRLWIGIGNGDARPSTDTTGMRLTSRAVHPPALFPRVFSGFSWSLCQHCAAGSKLLFPHALLPRACGFCGLW